MKILLLLIFCLVFLTCEIYCKNIMEGKMRPKLSCNEVSRDDSVESFSVNFYLNTCDDVSILEILMAVLAEDMESEEELKEELKECGYKPNLPTVILVHGFVNNHKEDWVQDMKNAFIENKSVNLILVDWHDAFIGLDGLNYRAAALSTEKVAFEISDLIQNITNVYRIPLKNMPPLHFIGHSLGAHVVGQAARILKARTGLTVHRITGLDPAHPCFETDATIRLRKSDAQFVDVIHSNSAWGKNPNFGSYDQLGHIDFYLNGGNHQPGCLKDDFEISTLSKAIDRFVNRFFLRTAFEDGFIDWIEYASEEYLNITATDLIMNYFESDYNLVCNHNKAAVYFTRSLNPNKKYFAVPVNTLPIVVSKRLVSKTQDCIKTKKCIEMGINAIEYNKARGAYYVNTRKYKKY